jgi:AcrR family transcriptional regulator
VGLSRLPQQERSTQSLARLLDAAERLMGRQHFDDISVAAIAKEASTSIGNFYGRFASKDELLSALQKRYEDDRTELWREFFDSRDWSAALLAERALAVVRVIISNYRARAGVLRTLTDQWRHPAKMDERTRKRLGGIYEEAFAFLLERVAEIRHPKPRQAVEVGMASVLAACRETIVMRPRELPASLKLSDDDLAAELARMLCAYLSAPQSSKRAARA